MLFKSESAWHVSEPIAANLLLGLAAWLKKRRVTGQTVTKDLLYYYDCGSRPGRMRKHVFKQELGGMWNS